MLLESLDLQDLQERGDHYAKKNRSRTRAFWSWIGGLFTLGVLIQLIPKSPKFDLDAGIYTDADVWIFYLQQYSLIVLVILGAFIFFIFMNRASRASQARAATVRKRLPDVIENMTEYQPIHADITKPQKRYIGVWRLMPLIILFLVTVFLQPPLWMLIIFLGLALALMLTASLIGKMIQADRETRTYLWRNIVQIALNLFMWLPLVGTAIYLIDFVYKTYNLPIWFPLLTYLLTVFPLIRIINIFNNKLLVRRYYGALLRGDVETSLNRIEVKRKVSPKKFQFMMIHAYILQELGRYQDAETVYREAITEAQNGSPAIVATLLLGLGQVVEEQGRWDEAMRYYEVATKINPESSTPYMRIVQQYLRRDGNPQRAFELSSLMMRYFNKPWFRGNDWRYNWAFTQGIHGQVLARIGDEDGAQLFVSYIEDHLSREKYALYSAYLELFIGSIYKVLGNDDQALQKFQKSHEIYPNGRIGEWSYSEIQSIGASLT